MNRNISFSNLIASGGISAFSIAQFISGILSFNRSVPIDQLQVIGSSLVRFLTSITVNQLVLKETGVLQLNNNSNTTIANSFEWSGVSNSQINSNGLHCINNLKSNRQCYFNFTRDLHFNNFRIRHQCDSLRNPHLQLWISGIWKFQWNKAPREQYCESTKWKHTIYLGNRKSFCWSYPL